MKMLPVMREMFTTRTFLSAMSKQGRYLFGKSKTVIILDIATLRDHARFTAKMFDMIIKNLDTEDKKRTDTLSECNPVFVGRAHTCLRPYGFVGTMWEKLGEIIIDVVLTQEAVRDLPGADKCHCLFEYLQIDIFRTGLGCLNSVHYRPG